MELLSVLLMVAAGGMAAAFIATAMAIARRENEPPSAAPQRDSVAASLLFHVASAGGSGDEEALRQVRRTTGIVAPVTRGIDITNWAESFARAVPAQQRQSLLESAVQLVASRGVPIPVRQYAALLDLSFGLGFQTDALARLRRVYGFDYVDHAGEGRPRTADRGDVAAPLYERGPGQRAELLALLELAGDPTRQELSAAYRRLVARHHPDRFHAGGEEERRAAAGRFIEITRAYEELMLQFRD